MILTAGSFFFLEILLCHKSACHFCITFHKHSELLPNDLRMLLFRVNIRRLRQENNLWNPRLGKQTGLIPLAMAVAVGRNSAHNAYQLRLPVIFWLRMETGQKGRIQTRKENIIYVGIDLHKETHTAVMLDCWNQKLGEITFENKPSEFHKLTRKVSRF